MSLPLVTVICLGYNHGPYISEAIKSVVDQTYTHVQLVVVDDASTDDSASVVASLLEAGFAFEFIQNKANQGNCKSFNIGLQKAKGKYVIDLAADDILLPERIAKGVADFEKSGDQVGVSFCDTWLVNAGRERLRTHFQRNSHWELVEVVPEGDLYRMLIKKHLISAPTMMMRKTMFVSLEGYDEKLAYEDFDFWIRSARNWGYSFINEVLVEKRILSDSLSTMQFQKGSQHEMTTYKVCEKAFLLNKNKGDHLALIRRLLYECKQAIFREDFRLLFKYSKLFFRTSIRAFV
jgi:glycosyltransferase involved in cell wall biosynthesis